MQQLSSAALCIIGMATAPRFLASQLSRTRIDVGKHLLAPKQLPYKCGRFESCLLLLLQQTVCSVAAQV
jgi:hypothetical protein